MYVEVNTCKMCVGKNYKANMKNMPGKMMSNNRAECPWEIDMSVYKKCMWRCDLPSHFKNLLILCYVFTKQM